jgi:hypothetical protein
MGIFLVTLCILLAGAVAWSFVSPILLKNASISYKEFIGLAMTVTTFVTLRRSRERVYRESPAKPFRLAPSFDSGIAGGFVGGALAGLFIGIIYYVQFSSSDSSLTLVSIPETFVYGAFSGMFLGACIQFVILWFRHLATEKQYSAAVFNEVSGGIFGGGVGGTVIGVLAMLLFGASHDEFVGIVPLATGTIFGVILVATGALFYDYGGRWQNVARFFIASLLITAATATAAVVTLQRMNIEEWVYATSSALAVQGAAILGVVIGMMAGLQVGLTLVLYRFWAVSKP